MTMAHVTSFHTTALCFQHNSLQKDTQQDQRNKHMLLVGLQITLVLANYLNKTTEVAICSTAYAVCTHIFVPVNLEQNKAVHKQKRVPLYTRQTNFI